MAQCRRPDRSRAARGAGRTRSAKLSAAAARAVQERQRRQVPGVAERSAVSERRRPRRSASICRRDCSRSTRSSGADTVTTSRPSTPITRCAGCAGRWSTARTRAGVTRRQRPICEEGRRHRVLRQPGRQSSHLSRFLTRRLPSRPTRSIPSGCRQAGCSSIGTRAR